MINELIDCYIEEMLGRINTIYAAGLKSKWAMTAFAHKVQGGNEHPSPQEYNGDISNTLNSEEWIKNMLHLLVDFNKEHGVTTQFVRSIPFPHHNAFGVAFSRERLIVIRTFWLKADRPQAALLETLIHESAHIIMNHRGGNSQTRRHNETVAEATSYVVSRALGLIDNRTYDPLATRLVSMICGYTSCRGKCYGVSEKALSEIKLCSYLILSHLAPQ